MGCPFRHRGRSGKDGVDGGDGAATTDVDRRRILKQLGVGLLGASIPTGVVGSKAPSGSDWPGFAEHPSWRPLEVGTGDTLLAPTKVAGVDTEAILDTGSGASIISWPLAAKLGMANLEPRRIAGLSGKAAVGLVHNVEVTLADQVHVLPFAVVADLGAISAAYGRPIHIMLGADVLASGCVALDFGKRRFAFGRSGSFAGGEGWTTLTLEHGARQELLVHASVNGSEPVPLMLDTGSSSALMLSAAFVEERNLLANKASSTAALGGVEGVQIVRTFTTDSVSLAGISTRVVPTLALDRWASVSTVGNIGMPLLGQFDIVLDVTLGRLWIRPIPHRSRLPMLKDRSGLGIAASPTDLTVIHVAVGSPAAQGGWTVGDRVVALNGFPIDTSYTRGALWQWRYGRPGEVVTLTLADGAMRTLKLADYY